MTPDGILAIVLVAFLIVTFTVTMLAIRLGQSKSWYEGYMKRVWNDRE